MKKFLKITLIVIAVLVLLIIALPFLFKGKIVKLVKSEANKQLTATVDFDNDIGLSLIKNFPNFTITIKKLSIADSTDMDNDTLLSVQKLSATLDIMSVIKGDKIEIKSILLDNPRVYAKVDENGKANWDIMKTDTTAPEKPEDTTSNFKMGLEKFKITDGRIVYDDREGKIYAELNGVNHELSGDFTQDLFTMKTTTDAQSVTVGMDGLNYLNKVKANLKADIEADMKQFKFTFKENELQLNELFAGFDGWVAMPEEDINMDLKFAARKTDFKNILSLVPAVYTQDFANVKTSGKLGLNGTVKGTYNDNTIPGFNINLLVEDGMFQYPGMPSDMKNIFVDLNVTNPDGVMDNTVINLKRLDFIMTGEPFSARLLAKNPTTDPYVDMAAKGKINLTQMAGLVPLEKGTSLAGIISADMSAKGRVSTVESGHYENFDAKGSIVASDIVYQTDSFPKTTITTAQLNFNPKTVELPSFTAQIGKSDLTLKAAVSNFFGYFLGNQTLTGSMDIKSNLLDANEFITGSPSAETPQPKDTVPMSVVEIPNNIDFTLNLDVARMLYTNLDLRNLGGTAKVAQQTLTLTNVHTDVLGGNINMGGSYSTIHPSRPEVKLNLAVKGLESGQVFAFVNPVKQVAPLLQYIEGKISADFDLNTFLDKTMSPELNTLSSKGKLEIPNAKLAGYPPLVKLGEALKMDQLKSLALNKILLTFKIENGRIFLDPFKTNLAGIPTEFEGSSGLDRTLDYTAKLAVPRKLFGPANTALDNLMKEAGKQGLELKPNEVVNVNVHIGGTTSNPKITTSTKEIVKNTLEDLKDAAKQKLEEEKQKALEKADAELQKRIDEAKKAGDKLIADAQAKADAIKAEARKQADAIIAEGDKKADELVKAAKNPIAKEAAKIAADKTKKEAREKADKAVAEANAKADGIVNEARKQADQLVKDAEAGKNTTLGK